MELLRDNVVDVFAWVLRTSVEASILVLVILILKALLRDRISVRWHSAVWLLVIAKLLIPWAPESPISLYNISHSTLSSFMGNQETSPSASIQRASAPAPSHLQKALALEPTDRRRVAISGRETPSVEDRVAAIEVARAPKPRFAIGDMRPYVLPGLWLSGMVILLGTVYVSNRRFLASVYKNRPVIDERILETLERCKEEMGVHHPILIYPTRGKDGPALLGFVRPRILIPSEMLNSMSLSDIRCVLLHELAHIKRKDILINWLSTALLAVHWFNPVIWLAFRRLHADRELACDALALQCSKSSEASEYGGAILRLLERFAKPRLQTGVAGILEDGSQLKRRMKMIAHFSPKSLRWSPLAMALMTALMVIGLTSALPVSYAVDLAAMEAPGERTLEIPDESGDGFVSIGTREWQIENYDGLTPTIIKNETISRVQGQVQIPDNRELGLHVIGNPWGDLTPLETIPPDTFQTVHIWELPDYETDRWLTADDFGILSQQRLLRALHISGAPVTDEALPPVIGLPLLVELVLERTAISDLGLTYVGEMSGLRYLDLQGTQITDAGLAFLGEMDSLRTLILDGTAISDAGLPHIQGLQSLEVLGLNRTAVTNDGIRVLRSLPALRELRTTSTYVTAEGLDKLPNLAPTRTESFVRSQVKVGIRLSKLQAARWGDDGYRFAQRILEPLVNSGFDVYAITDPGTEDVVELSEILEANGISDVQISTYDRDSLRNLDVIVAVHETRIQTEALHAFHSVVNGGVGLLNFGILGGRDSAPGGSERNELLGIDYPSANYIFRTTQMQAAVQAEHPILGPMKKGDQFSFIVLNAMDGKTDGTHLLDPPSDADAGAIPLYVRELGDGRVVNCQWIGFIDPADNFTLENFLTRCVLWAAKFPLEE